MTNKYGFLKKVTETNMFERINFLITSKRKKELDELKIKLSLISNVKIDNSTFLRGVINYFKENDEQLNILKDYMLKNKGKYLFNNLEDLIKNNASDEEIYNSIGLSSEKLNELKNK